MACRQVAWSSPPAQQEPLIAAIASPDATSIPGLQDSMADATVALDARADQVRETTGAWPEALRGTVHTNPLAAVGAAPAIGLVVARPSR